MKPPVIVIYSVVYYGKGREYGFCGGGKNHKI